MPRLPRAEYESGLYHVYARGNRKQPIYVDDRDRARYLNMLGRVTTKMRWRCLSYCLMGNHMHLIIETVEPNLGAGMHRLQGGYAQYFNRRHGFVGHLFQDRFEAVPVMGEMQFWRLAAYVARNPVEAGLCAEPGDWPWSSHAAVLTGRTPAWLDRARLLAYFGADGGDPLARYRERIEFAALTSPLPKGDSPL
jgi:putative transposase